MLVGFWNAEDGQDFTEYTLLIAFVVVLAGAVLMLSPDAIAACIRGVDSHLDRAKQIGR